MSGHKYLPQIRSAKEQKWHIFSSENIEYLVKKMFGRAPKTLFSRYQKETEYYDLITQRKMVSQNALNILWQVIITIMYCCTPSKI